MTDSGKHSALRQTDDGSFELVFDREGLHEVSEEEVSLAEVSAPEPPAAARTSSRVLIFSAAGVGALLLLTAIGWWALSPSDSEAADVEEVSGFKAYTGGAEPSGDNNAQKQAERRARIAAMAAEAEELEGETEPAEVAVETPPPEPTEPGWELAEEDADGVIVEVEGTDPVEEEVADADIVEEGEEGDQEIPEVEGGPSLMSRKRVDILRNTNLGRTIQAPRVPALQNNPLGAGRQLPIRNLRPAPTEEGEAVDEFVGEGEEIVEEEVPEDGEAVDGEELE